MIPAPSFAHHGIAAYQEAKEITVTGSVTYFDFVNPARSDLSECEAKRRHQREMGG